MLCYESSELKNMIVGDIFFENINGSDALLAGLLLNSLDIWSRYSPMREYNRVGICSDKISGKPDLIKSITTASLANGNIHCDVFKLNVDTVYNRVIKLALHIILNCTKDIDECTFSRLQKYYTEFSAVSNIDVFSYRTITVNFSELPNYYKPVIASSKIVIENIIASDKRAESDRASLYVLEDHNRYQYIFEGFVKAFYRTEYARNGIKYSEHKWPTLNDFGKRNGWSIPDVVLTKDTSALIIDTKWYTRSEHTDRDKANQYQMRAYLSELFKRNTQLKTLNGVILYADTGQVKKEPFNIPGFDYKYYRRAINLNQDFSRIKQDLVDLADEFLK